jgi:hypothetical protein
MKIHIYQRDYAMLFQRSIKVLNEMKFIVQYSNSSSGLISAYRNDDHIRIIDLKFNFNNGLMWINVIPGILSDDFLCISYDEKIAGLFAENMIASIRHVDVDNSFRLKNVDYLASIAV